MVTMIYDDDYVDDYDDEFEYDDNMILMKLIMIMIYALLFIILKYSSKMMIVLFNFSTRISVCMELCLLLSHLKS